MAIVLSMTTGTIAHDNNYRKRMAVAERRKTNATRAFCVHVYICS
jgi:hypothetical protein